LNGYSLGGWAGIPVQSVEFTLDWRKTNAVMQTEEKRIAWLATPVLTKKRMWIALAVAVSTDLLQLVLGPLGWIVIDESLDVVAFVLTTAALGFHMLLLPTFALEFLPMVDMLPTWTGCVAAVIMLRKRAQAGPVPPPEPASPPPIDVKAEVTRVPPQQ
jgi:hypothetical protein